jgi:hypothetical protein
MHRTFFASLAALALVGVAVAQDGPLNRAGQALDRAGKNIRYRVETEVARGQVAAEERDVLNRVVRRIEWDKRFVGSTLQLESRAGGTVVLRGSVLNPQVKLRAVEIVENTIGVTAVVDELAVVKEVKVIKAQPAETVIEVTPPVPTETKVIVKP